MLPVFTEKFKKFLRYYLFTGGMPEAVLQFVKDRNWAKIREIQQAILTTYERDSSKYAPYEVVPRLNMVWHNIPAQLAKENKKFIYGVMKEGARAMDDECAAICSERLFS